MKKRFLLLYILICLLSFTVYSVDRTEIMLDSAIEEFSKENYEKALEILDLILLNEPGNQVALDYRKTIEDISKIEEDEIKDETTDGAEPVYDNKPVVDEDIKENNKSDVLSFATYIAATDDKKLIVEQGIKVIFGLPMAEFIVRTNSIDYDVLEFSSNFPSEDFLDSSSYNFDFSLGIRSIPFKDRTNNGGYADFKIGANKFSQENSVVPYVGFDSQIHILSIFANNTFFDNFWIGGKANLYIHNDKIVDNYLIAGKAGINIGILDMGLFYGVSNMETFESEDFNKTFYGLKLGLSF